jgi:hypothetical protein
VIFESIFLMMSYFTKNTCFDFVSNIMANLACLEEGRKFMVEEKYIEAIVVQMVTKNLNQHRRTYLMACLRNLLFDYEKYKEKFLEMNVPRDVLKVLIDEQGITEDRLPEEWKFCSAKGKKSEEEIDMEISSSLVDCLVLLANDDELLKRMHVMNTLSIIDKFKLSDKYEDTELRLQVLKNQLLSIGKTLKEEEEQKKEDEKKDDDEMPSLEQQDM